MIKAVIFDLGRVIVPFDFSRGYARLEKLSGLPTSEIPKRLAGVGLVESFECGLIEPADFVRRFGERLDCAIPYDQFCEIWNSIFLPETLIPESMLAAIAQRYPLILLSNTNRIHFEGIRANYPLL